MESGDFGNVMAAAIGFNSGQSFQDFPYFFDSPNNANISILLSYIYPLIGSPRKLVMVGALLTNLSSILVSKTVKNITKNDFSAVFALIISEILMAITWRAFIVYTDNFSMIFVALSFYIYTSNINAKYKIPIVIGVCILSAFIKITVLLCLISIIIHYLFYKDFKNKSKQLVPIVITIASVLCLFLFQNTARKAYGLDLNEQFPKNWQYMLMVGQNLDSYGVTNSQDGSLRITFMSEAANLGKGNDYVSQKTFDEAVSRIKQRGIFGNISFYIKKIVVAYNDGYFHNVQQIEPENSENLIGNISYRLLWKTGDLYHISADIIQTAWDCVLILLLSGSVLLWRNDCFW